MLDALDTAVIQLNEQDCIELMNGAAEVCLGTGKGRARGVTLSDTPTTPFPGATGCATRTRSNCL